MLYPPGSWQEISRTCDDVNKTSDCDYDYLSHIIHVHNHPWLSTLLQNYMVFVCDKKKTRINNKNKLNNPFVKERIVSVPKRELLA